MNGIAPDLILTDAFALAMVRQLSGAPGYPFHLEGEIRIADIVRECSKSVRHAQAIIEEFETTFPTIDQIRAAARRLAEQCTCGIRRHEHADRGCKRFQVPDEFAPTATDRQNAEAWNKFKHSIPEIPGVRWEVCLEIQTIRIDLGMCGSPPDRNRIEKHERYLPEAVAALRAGRTPDYKLVEAVLSKRIPGWARSGRSGMAEKHMTSGAERLAGLFGVTTAFPYPQRVGETVLAEEEPEQ